MQLGPTHTGKIKLSNGKNNFERAIEDTFSLSKLPNVGAMTHILIGHDDAYLSPSWHLAEARVFNMVRPLLRRIVCRWE